MSMLKKQFINFFFIKINLIKYKYRKKNLNFKEALLQFLNPNPKEFFMESQAKERYIYRYIR